MSVNQYFNLDSLKSELIRRQYGPKVTKSYLYYNNDLNFQLAIRKIEDVFYLRKTSAT